MATLSISDRIPIPNTEASVPSLGFGTYYIDGTDCEAACLTAFRAGYRHIDTAQSYRNEANVGKAVGQAGLKREDVFLTSKLGRTQNSVDETYKSILGSVEKLGGYIDLFLIHQPGAKDSRKDIWAALEKLYAEGKVKAIGVSNFRVRHLQEMKEYATVWPPHVNQIELHPWNQQRELVDFCTAQGIVVQAYSPLATGTRLEDPAVGAVATKHGKQPAQVLIRWALQKGWVPLPKSATTERIESNAAVYDFALDDDDVKALDALELGVAGALYPSNMS